MLSRRFNLLLVCFVGSFLGALIGLLAVIKTGSPVLAVLAASVLPVVCCSVAGFQNPKLLAKIAIYAAIGWGLTFVLQPQISQSSTSSSLRVASATFAGYGWYLPCSFVSCLMAMTAGVSDSRPEAT